MVWGCHGVLLRLLVDTLADCSPPMGLVWPETPPTAVCMGQAAGERGWERPEDPAVCLIYVLPPEVSFEQRVLR